MSGDAAAPAFRHILGVRVEAVTAGDLVRRVLAWAGAGESRSVCFATVYNLMLAHDVPDFRQAIGTADLVMPDGMPLVWSLHWLGVKEAVQVCGPELTPLLLEAAARSGAPVGFYGGRPRVLEALVERVRRQFPPLQVTYAWSPPFRPLTPEEEQKALAEIRASGVRILFVGLGTPKQDLWMAAHRGSVPAVMLGVGQTFDLLAGAQRRAPRWMRTHGLEWLFRLLHEPRRLWKRYLWHNPRFVLLFARQLWRARRAGPQLLE